MLKRSSVNNLPILIGLINIILVVIIFTCTLFINYKKIPSVLLGLLEGYVKYSFVVAVISFILTLMANKKITMLNLANIMYIVLYIITYLAIQEIVLGI